MSHFVGHLKLTQLHKAIGFQKKKKRNSTLLKTTSTDMDNHSTIVEFYVES